MAAKPKYESDFTEGECGGCGETKTMHKDDYQCLECRGLGDPTQERLEAAEDVCWTLLMMMALGGLELEQEWRDYLTGSYEKWTDLAVATGIMNREEDDDAASDEAQEEDKEATADETAGDH